MKPRALSPGQFFALRLDEGSMSDAHCRTRISYATVHDAKSGKRVSVDVAERLASWAADVPAARALGVTIDPVVAVGLAPPPALPKRLAERIAKQPVRARAA